MIKSDIRIAISSRENTGTASSLGQNRHAILTGSHFTHISIKNSLQFVYAEMVFDPIRRACSGIRLPLLIECNKKKGLGCTLGGTRRKRARVSGFRARMATVGGRKVLAARRKKGRHALAPGGMPIRK